MSRIPDLKISGHPDAVIVETIEHIRYHGDVLAIAVEFSCGYVLTIMECEREVDVLEVVVGEPREIGITLQAFDRIAKIVSERRGDAV